MADTTVKETAVTNTTSTTSSLIPRLRPTQIQWRASKIRELLSNVPKEDVRLIMQRAGILDDAETAAKLNKAVAESTPVDDETLDWKDIKKAMKAGVNRLDPQMARAAMEYLKEQAGKEYLSKLEVEFTDYRIADASIPMIIEELADEYVPEVKLACKKRGII